MEDKNKNDLLVAQLQDKLRLKRGELIEPGRFNMQTSCSFKPFGSNTAININTLTKISDLLWVGMTLTRYRQDFYLARASYDNADDEEFSFEGYSYDAWKSDIQARIDRIAFQKKKVALDALEKRLGALESDEMKTAKELELILAILNK